jgi:hypothetical protein
MIAYGRYLQEQGWIFQKGDSGNQLDWLAGAQMFAKFVLDTSAAAQGSPAGVTGQTFYFSPIAAQASFASNFGIVQSVKTVRNGAYGVLDVDGNPIAQESFTVNRSPGRLDIIRGTNARAIYGVRLQVAAYQHVVFFSNTTRFGDIIYDPVLGMFQPALYVDSYRTTGWVGRLEAPGFIIQERGNLLPNFEKQVKDITRLYSLVNPVDDPTMRDQARNRYGYIPDQSYMTILDAEDRTQFDFYRGLLKAKGTKRAIIAYSRGTRVGTGGVIVTEDWAWRLASFGDTRITFVEFIVNGDDFTQPLQVISFTDTAIPDGVPYIGIPSYNRNDLSENTRWIIPPPGSAIGNMISNFTFPVTPMGNYIVDASGDYVTTEDGQDLLTEVQ